jgi:hypothetical protein
MTIKTFAAIAALALLGTAGSANAAIKASGTNPSNFSWTTPTALIPINGAGTSITVSNTKATKLIITFSAECSADAGAGVTSGWVDVDLLLNGVAISPTNGSSDAFCSPDGITGHGSWVRPSVTTVVTAPPGVSTISVLGRLTGVTGGWLSDTSVVVQN